MKRLTICCLLAVTTAGLLLTFPASLAAQSDTITSTIVITVLDKPPEFGQAEESFNQTLVSQVSNVRQSQPKVRVEPIEQGGVKLQCYTIIDRL